MTAAHNASPPPPPTPSEATLATITVLCDYVAGIAATIREKTGEKKAVMKEVTEIATAAGIEAPIKGNGWTLRKVSRTTSKIDPQRLLELGVDATTIAKSTVESTSSHYRLDPK